MRTAYALYRISPDGVVMYAAVPAVLNKSKWALFVALFRPVTSRRFVFAHTCPLASVDRLRIDFPDPFQLERRFF